MRRTFLNKTKKRGRNRLQNQRHLIVSLISQHTRLICYYQKAEHQNIKGGKATDSLKVDIIYDILNKYPGARYSQEIPNLQNKMTSQVTVWKDNCFAEEKKVGKNMDKMVRSFTKRFFDTKFHCLLQRCIFVQQRLP